MKKSFLFLAVLGLVGMFFVIESRGKVPTKFTVDKQWKQADDMYGLVGSAWTLKTDPDVMVTVSTHDQTRLMDSWTKSKFDKSFEEFKEGRKAVNRLASIKDWKITSHDFSEEPTYRRLTIRGSYTDSHDNPVEFREEHFFRSQHYSIFSVSYPPTSKFARDKQYESVAKRFVASESEEGGAQ